MMVFPGVFLLLRDENDRDFMEQLYRDHHRLMYWAALRVLGARRELDDVVEDACLSLMRKISVIRPMDGNILRAYVISTVRNTALSHLRTEGRLRRAHVGDELLGDACSEEPGPLDQVLLSDLVARLMDAIERLPARDQDVLRMKYLSDMSDGEIALALGIQAVTVRVELSRARKHAYELMTEMEKNGAR